MPLLIFIRNGYSLELFMFKSPTIFVIGAGASKELGLPLGDELKTKITKAISFKKSNYGIDGGDEHVRDSIFSAVREGKFSQHEVMAAAKKYAQRFNSRYR